MSTTRMMVLGIVRWLQPVHGYDVRRELASWNVEEWADLKPGSVYHALKKLTVEGLLAEVATEQVGGRPARTTYRVTPEGDAHFRELLRRYWWQNPRVVDPFHSALAFLPALERREAVLAFRNRARVLRAQADRLRDSLTALAAPGEPALAHEPGPVGAGDRAADGAEVNAWATVFSGPGASKPAYVGWMFELGAEHAEVEAAWCERTAGRIEAGEGSHSGDGEVEMVEGWRRSIAANSASNNQV